MSHWAKPGVKCVCISDDFVPLQYRVCARIPAKGATYTIREVMERNGKFGLRFHEIVNEPFDFKNDPGIEPIFAIRFFRPLITKTQEQDVALFRHILDGLPIFEDAQ